MSKIWYLEEVDLFQIICPHYYKPYRDKHPFKDYKKDEFIYFADDKSDKIFLIANGKVKIATYTEDGNEVVKGILTKGEIFGELAVLGEEKRQDFAQSLDDKTTICQLDLETFHQLIKDNTNFSLKIFKIIGLRVKKLERKLEQLMFKDAKTRLLEFLLDLAEEKGQKKENKIFVKHFYSQQNIADLIGTSRQTLNGLMNELKEEGWIDFNRKEIIILKNLRVNLASAS
jgi:CRP-like cAMP-binding protein